MPEQAPCKRDEIFSWRCILARDRGTQQLAGFLFEGPPMSGGAGLEAGVQQIVDISDQQAGHTFFSKSFC
jgi:hypothetical protein